MYKPKSSDVLFTEWQSEGNKDYVVARAVIFLVDPTYQHVPMDPPPEDYHDDKFYGMIATRRSVSVNKNASPKIKRQALEFARDHLIDTFDVRAAGKNVGFKGNYDELEPRTDFPHTYSLEEALAL